MIEQEFIDIPETTLLLKIKKECSEHSTSDWKIVLNNRLFTIVNFHRGYVLSVWKIVDYFLHFSFSNVFNSQNGLLQYTSIGDKFFRFEKLLIMSSILVFYLP